MSTKRVVLGVCVAWLAACHDRGASQAPDGGPARDGTSTTGKPPRWPDGAAAMVPAGSTIWLDEAGTRAITLPHDMPGGGLVVRVADTDGGERIAVDTEADAACPDVGLFGLRLRVFASAFALTESRTTACPAAVDPKPVVIARVTGGAEVFWRDGTKAGSVPRTRPMFGTMVAAGARTCFPVAIAPRDEITLCFPVASVAQPEGVVGTGGVAVPPPDANVPAVMHGGAVDGGLLDGASMLGSSDGDRGDFGSVGIGGGGVGEGTIGLGRLGGMALVPEVQVRLGKAKVVGKLDRDIVRRIVRAHSNEIRGCHREALLDAPGLEGETTVAFTIHGDGSTGDARVTASLGDAFLDECMVNALSRWKFPKPDGTKPVLVTYPLTLAIVSD